MDTASHLVLAATTHEWGVLVAFIIGFVVVVGGLVWAVWLGIRVMRREPDRPNEAEQPHLPVTGAVHEISEMRDLDELHPEDGERIMPYALHTTRSKRSPDQHRPRWSPGSSGSFGGGGGGRT
ncbi:DUF6479 family protein [Streptomyces sp. NPDC046197]|uniref:DUF6479 family protein n=1 Tax=Streptomyces sp. NPDC046197 TaxID=3154337 RepID=UPI0033C818EA